MPVSGVNLQLMQHYINVPNTRSSSAARGSGLLITADSQQLSDVGSNDSRVPRDNARRAVLWLRRAARTRVPRWVTGTTRKCFDYKELQSSLGAWHHAPVNASR